MPLPLLLIASALSGVSLPWIKEVFTAPCIQFKFEICGVTVVVNVY